MSRINNNNEAVRQEVQGRFFEVLALMKKQGMIHSKREFCNLYGLNINKYYKIETQSDFKGFRYKCIDIEAVYYLHRDFGVSLNWLFTGKGKMFENRTS